MRYVEKTLNNVLDRLSEIYKRDIAMEKTKYKTNKKYFSLESYLSYFGVDLSDRVRTILGMRLASVCRRAGIITFKEKSDYHSSRLVNTYPTFIMRKVLAFSFGDDEVWMNDGFINLELNEFLVLFFEQNKDIVTVNKRILFNPYSGNPGYWNPGKKMRKVLT